MDYEDEQIRKDLQKMYWEESKSLNTICAEMGVPYSSIHKLFVQLGIRVRSKKQAQKLVWKKRNQTRKQK